MSEVADVGPVDVGGSFRVIARRSSINNRPLRAQHFDWLVSLWGLQALGPGGGGTGCGIEKMYMCENLKTHKLCV
jgi:hypothetical protein